MDKEKIETIARYLKDSWGTSLISDGKGHWAVACNLSIDQFSLGELNGTNARFFIPEQHWENSAVKAIEAFNEKKPKRLLV